MKKVILCIGTTAIVALAVFNLNLTINKNSQVSVALYDMLSLAQNESSGNCTTAAFIVIDGCHTSVDYFCASGGNDYSCRTGFEEKLGQLPQK